MRLKIHYTIDAIDTWYTVSADTIEEIREQNEIEMKKRNLEVIKNNCWSEEIE